MYAVRVVDDNCKIWYYSVSRLHTKEASGHWYDRPVPYTQNKGKVALVEAREAVGWLRAHGYHYYEAPAIMKFKRRSDNPDYLDMPYPSVVELQEVHYYEVKDAHSV